MRPARARRRSPWWSWRLGSEVERDELDRRGAEVGIAAFDLRDRPRGRRVPIRAHGLAFVDAADGRSPACPLDRAQLERIELARGNAQLLVGDDFDLDVGPSVGVLRLELPVGGVRPPLADL